jgi:hypothetical protein
MKGISPACPDGEKLKPPKPKEAIQYTHHDTKTLCRFLVGNGISEPDLFLKFANRRRAIEFLRRARSGRYAPLRSELHDGKRFFYCTTAPGDQNDHR